MPDGLGVSGLRLRPWLQDRFRQPGSPREKCRALATALAGQTRLEKLPYESEGKLSLELVYPRPQDIERIQRILYGLAQEPRLADARRALNEHQTTLVGGRGIDRRTNCRQLLRTFEGTWLRAHRALKSTGPCDQISGRPALVPEPPKAHALIMSGIRVTLDLNPAGTTVRGMVASGSAETVKFSGWLKLMQTLERLLGEAAAAPTKRPDPERAN